MKWQNRLWGAALLLTLGLGPLARGQDGPGPAKHFYNKTTFRIPVVIDDAERGALAELKLYVRQQPGEWTCAATGPATQKSFSYLAQRDGEYWFSIATVDKAGKMVPEDLRQTEPGLIVVVDTQPPDIEVKPLTVGSGQVYLQCRLLDPNPDYSTVRIQYQTSDGSWQPLEGLANAPGVVQVPDPRVLDGKVRVKAADRAGNVGEREIDLTSTRVAGPPPTIKAGPSHSTPPSELPLVKDNAPPLRAVSDTRPPIEVPGAPLPPLSDAPASPAIVPPSTVTSNKPQPVSPLPSDGGPLPPRAPADAPARAPELAAEGPRTDGAQVACINTTRCRLDFALDATPGGIAEVEVWATTDGCRTWKPVGVSKDGRSPALVEFPGEGKYGIAFVVKPLNGLTSALPKAGEAPDGWLEIDTTLPVAALTSAAPGSGPDAGFLVLNWTAKDANLGHEPIAFWYATQPGGPWQLVSDRVPNSGTHRWPLPKNTGPQIWLRMEVRDRAGNVTRCETPQPIALEGPRARVRVLNIGPARE